MNIKARKISLLLRDGPHCIFCKKHIKDALDLTIDHIVPKIKGGSDSIDNTALCCKNCNDEKGRLLLTDFIKAKEIVITKKIMRFL